MKVFNLQIQTLLHKQQSSMQQGQGSLEETRDGYEVMWLSPASQSFAESLAMWSPPRKKDKYLALQGAEEAMRGMGWEEEGEKEEC